MKKALALIVLSTLLVAFAAGIFSIDSVSANFIWPREVPPEGYRIFSDGTFQGQNMHRDGNTYTLTGNVDCPIAIEKDNVVLDGAGYAVQGNGISSITWSEGGSGYSGGGADNSGVWLKERNGVTIKNLTIKNFDYGINFVSDYYSNWKESTNCNIIGNNIIHNQFGLSLKSSKECYIVGNYVANNARGVFMGSQSTLRNNTFVDNQAHFYNFDRANGDIDTSNTVDGKPIYYLYNQQHMTVPSNAGLVVLYNCRAIEVKGVSIKNNLHGIYLANTYDSTISGNDITNNINGISLVQCSNNIISGNYVANNNGNGISLSRSEDNKVYNNTVIGNAAGISFLEPNTVSKNVVIANRKDGIDADADSVITANYVAENLGNGIFLRHINGSTIEGNKVTLNKGCGIGFGYGPDGAVKNNIISKNGLGIWISNAFNNIISENEVTENDGYGIRLEGSHHDNLIYRNNFIDNSHKGVQASIPDVWYNPMNNGKYAPPQIHATPKPLTFEGATNKWDNGTEGNYWSDSQSSTYVINPDNQDNHPLLSPYNISATEVPETFPSQRTSTITAGTVSLTNILLATMLLAVIIVSALLYFKHRKKLVPP